MNKKLALVSLFVIVEASFLVLAIYLFGHEEYAPCILLSAFSIFIAVLLLKWLDVEQNSSKTKKTSEVKA